MSTFTTSRRAVHRRLPRFLNLLAEAYRIWKERQILAGLNDHQLADIGVSRAEAEAEASRSFFDIERR